MRRIAWQSLTTRGPGKWSNNHHTIDNKKTLCGRKIPQQVFRNDAFSEKDCQKCIQRRDAVAVYSTNREEKIAKFKEVVANLGGTYVFEDSKHKAWWDAYGDKKNLYIAYGKLSCLGVWLTANWLYLPLDEYAALQRQAEDQ
jgi:hypothetical protein